MQRIPRHRLLAAVLTFLSLMAIALLPMGGFVSTASAATNCPPGEGGPTCVLVISAPKSVATGRVFTVHVAVTTDRTTVATSDPCASKVLVTLRVYGPSGEGRGPLIFMQSVNAKAGIATYSLSVQSQGSYEIDASAGPSEGDAANCQRYSYLPDTANFQAVLVAADQPIAPCPDNVPCAQATSGSGSAATLFADTGTFSDVFFMMLLDQGCGDGGPKDINGVLNFNYAGASSKTIILALRGDLVTKGIGRYNICWRSSNPFTQRGGTPAPRVGILFTGFLPNCRNNDSNDDDNAHDDNNSHGDNNAHDENSAGPCVLFRKSGQHHSAFFGIHAPPGDPQAYPGL